MNLMEFFMLLIIILLAKNIAKEIGLAEVAKRRIIRKFDEEDENDD